MCPHCAYSCITKRNLDRHIVNNHVKRRRVQIDRATGLPIVRVRKERTSRLSLSSTTDRPKRHAPPPMRYRHDVDDAIDEEAEYSGGVTVSRPVTKQSISDDEGSLDADELTL